MPAPVGTPVLDVRARALVIQTNSLVSLFLSWTYSESDNTSFMIQRCLGGACIDFADFTGAAGTARSKTVDRDPATSILFPENTLMRFRVCAVNVDGRGPWSNIVTIRTGYTVTEHLPASAAYGQVTLMPQEQLNYPSLGLTFPSGSIPDHAAVNWGYMSIKGAGYPDDVTPSLGLYPQMGLWIVGHPSSQISGPGTYPASWGVPGNPTTVPLNTDSWAPPPGYSDPFATNEHSIYRPTGVAIARATFLAYVFGWVGLRYNDNTNVGNPTFAKTFIRTHISGFAVKIGLVFYAEEESGPLPPIEPPEEEEPDPEPPGSPPPPEEPPPIDDRTPCCAEGGPGPPGPIGPPGPPGSGTGTGGPTGGTTGSSPPSGNPGDVDEEEIEAKGPYIPWVPQCTGNGTVPDVADPDEGETGWTVEKARHPVAWAELYADKSPASLGTTTYRWSTRPWPHPSSYEGGKKDGRIINNGFSRIVRGCSNHKGSYEVGTMEFEILQADRLIDALMADDSTAFLHNREIVAKVVSEQGAATGAVPRRMFRGRIRQTPLTDPLGTRFQAEALFGTEAGAYALNRQVGVDKVDKLTFSNASDDVEGTTIPLYFGEHSDETDTPQDISKGVCPGIFVGMYPRLMSGTGAIPPSLTNPTYLEAPGQPAITIAGTGDTRQVTCSVTAYTRFGQTLPGPSLTVSNYPVVPSSVHSALWFITAPVNFVDQIIAYGLYVNGRRIALLTNNGAYTTPETSFTDNGTVVPSATPPAPTSNTALVDVTFSSSDGGGTVGTWGLVLFARHASPFVAIFGSDVGTNPKRVRWDTDAMPNDVVLAPSLEWGGKRYCAAWVRGPRLQHHIDRVVTISASICGQTQNADGTGPCIDQVGNVVQHLLCEWVWANNGDGYQTGDWQGVPLTPSGVPMFDTTSRQTYQDQTKVWMGNTSGYKCQFAVTAPTTVRELLQSLALSFNFFITVDGDGRFSMHTLNDTMDVTIGVLLREKHAGVYQIGRPQERIDLIENEIEYYFDWSPELGEYRAEARKLRHSQSIEDWYKAVYPVSYPVLTRDQATAETAVRKRLQWYCRAPIETQVILDATGVERKHFEPVLLSGHRGFGSSGFVNRPGLITRMEIQGPPNTVTLTVWDVGPITQNTFGVPTNGTVQWGDATTNVITWGDALTNTRVWG